MYKLVVTLFSVLLVINLCGAFKILVAFPFPGKSHTILGEGYVRHLLKAGHETHLLSDSAEVIEHCTKVFQGFSHDDYIIGKSKVTYITPIPLKSQTNLRQIDVSSNIEHFSIEKLFDLKKMIGQEINLSDMRAKYNMMHDIATMGIMHENVQKFIQDPKEEFDVVIGEWLYSELYAGFATVFNCPFIYSSSLEPHAMVLRLIDELPNPAYIPDFMSSIEPPFTFMERLKELWNILYLYYVRLPLSEKDENIFKLGFGPAIEKRGRPIPNFDEVKFNASMIFGNAHVSTGLAIRLPQNHISIAGYHINDEIPPLPDNLQKLMDNSPHGVIYFSMGSMMKSKSMPDDLKRDFLKVFATLKQTVIWKYEENIPNLPKNVHILQWAPQQSILAHSNCILFVTHGGLLSTTEALHYSVPIIGIPLFADQFINIKRAVSKGFALKVDLGYDTPAKLKVAIEEILGNPQYRKKVDALSFIYHDRPVLPGTELVHWVEHVVMTNGAPHLRSPALHVPWYQKMYLDLLAVIVIILITVVKSAKYLLKLVMKKDDAKKKKKN